MAGSIADFMATPPKTGHKTMCYGIRGRCPKCGEVIVKGFAKCQTCGWVVNEEELKSFSQ